MEREDSWAGILKVQEKITETVGGSRRPDMSGSVISLGARYVLPSYPVVVSHDHC